MLKITSLLRCCIAVIVLSAAMSPLANAVPWVFFTSGTITSGTDTSGVFGTPGTDLMGLTFSQSYTLDPTLFSNHYPGVTTNQSDGTLSGIATHTVTVNGVKQTFAWDLSQTHFGSSMLNNTLTQSGVGFDETYQYFDGFMADGTALSAFSIVDSLNNVFNIGLNFDQTWSYTTQSGDIGSSRFDIAGRSGIASFYAETPIYFSINPVSPVPEPQTYAMLLAGLGLLGITAYRRKNLNA